MNVANSSNAGARKKTSQRRRLVRMLTRRRAGDGVSTARPDVLPEGFNPGTQPTGDLIAHLRRRHGARQHSLEVAS